MPWSVRSRVRIMAQRGLLSLKRKFHRHKDGSLLNRVGNNPETSHLASVRAAGPCRHGARLTLSTFVHVSRYWLFCQLWNVELALVSLGKRMFSVAQDPQLLPTVFTSFRFCFFTNLWCWQTQFPSKKKIIRQHLPPLESISMPVCSLTGKNESTWLHHAASCCHSHPVQ